MKKKLLTIVLMLLPMLASAATKVNGIYYILFSDNVAYVTCMNEGSSNKDAYSGNVVIPETVTYNNRTYKVIRVYYRAFHDCTGLTSVTIPNSVTIIDPDAFYGCSSLKSVTISNSVNEIKDNTFYNCRSLTSVNIPNSVTRIGVLAFGGCSAMTSVTIPNSVKSIGNEAFWGCSGLTSITIPNSVKSIRDGAFYGCI